MDTKRPNETEQLLFSILKDLIAIDDDGAGRIDGGFDAWLVCAGGWCCSLVSPGWANGVLSASSTFHFRAFAALISATICSIR